MKKPLLFLLILSALNILNAQNLQSKITSLLSKLPSSTDYAVMIYDPMADDTIYAHNPTHPMIPASNTKLFTTIAAMNYIGADALVYTRILTDALMIDDGIIDGNIYLKGFGDPIFSYSKLESMVKKLADEGLRTVEGDVIADDTYYDNNYTRDDWILDEKANVDLPPVSALVLDDNSLSVRVTAKGKAGTPVSVKINNGFDFVTIVNNATVTTGRNSISLKLDTSGDNLRLTVNGKLRARKYPVYYSVYFDDPPEITARIFKKTLEKYGIAVKGNAHKGEAPIPGTDLVDVNTPLLELIKLTNKNSDNYKAECLFKMVGANYSGKQGNSFYATQAILTMIDEMGIYEEGTEVVDGSGISRFNFVTVAAVTDMLKHVYFHETLYEEFKNTLSVSGTDGTLRKRINTRGLKGNFYGKTGTLRGVTALSGYLEKPDGTDLIVSIIIRYSKMGGRYHKNIEDQIIELLY